MYWNFQDKEIHILLEDQQKINQFARLNNRLEEFKDDITAKKTEIQTLEDASTDMMMLEDDDEKIPYQIGEVFVSMTQVNTPFWKIGTNFSDTSRTVNLWISANHVGGGLPSTNKTVFIKCIIVFQRRRKKNKSFILFVTDIKRPNHPGAYISGFLKLCIQMDFKRTFQTNTKCNNINHVWSHFCKILVLLKYQ